MTRSDLTDPGTAPGEAPAGTSRRRFLTYLVAGPTLALAVRYADGAGAAVPSPPQRADLYDLGDFLIDCGRPTEGQLILLEVGRDGVVSCALPRAEVGQGLTTSIAMLIAEELDLPLAGVRVTLAPGRPELLFNQLTGGSNTVRSVWGPARQAAADARARMVAAAARSWGLPAATLRTADGAVHAPDGRSLSYGALAAPAADRLLVVAPAAPKALADTRLLGRPQSRVDALAMVTGRQKYTLDLDPVPGAARAMVRRPPTIGATVVAVENLKAVRAMPGVLDVLVIPTGVAVLARTFGQALDGKEALRVRWSTGPVEAEDNASLRRRLAAAVLPLPPAPPGTRVVDATFDYAAVSHAPLETNSAIAHITPDGGQVWSGMKSPIVAAQKIEEELGLPAGSVTANVVQAGGSFGRRLFFDAALEAARISLLSKRPVKLLWSRVDDMRHGRTRPPSHHRVRAVVAGGEVVSWDHQVSSIQVDYTHGLGEILTANGAAGPGGNKNFGQSVFDMTVKSPYDFGRTQQHLEEVELPLHTGAWRSVYSANTRGAEEVVVDEVARLLDVDPAQFRLDHLKTDRQRAVLHAVMKAGQWGRRMNRGFAQGIAYHEEYKSLTACLVELDVRDRQRPRVTRATVAADYGVPVNPCGLEAQLLGGLTDAIATTFRAGLHYDKGLPLEGSYSQFHFPRQAQAPLRTRIIILPATTEAPGGAGELGLPAAVGALANAYRRGTGRAPRAFPLHFPVDFTPFPRGTGSTRRRVRPPA